MKLLILLLFTTSALAAFNPIATAPITYYGMDTMGKGEILTSNGTSNGFLSVCADGEILEYDAAATAGIKCATKPQSGEQVTVYVSGLLNATVTSSPCPIPCTYLPVGGTPFMDGIDTVGATRIEIDVVNYDGDTFLFECPVYMSNPNMFTSTYNSPPITLTPSSFAELANNSFSLYIPPGGVCNSSDVRGRYIVKVFK